MNDAREIKLHYFDARGRAQFIRYYFDLRVMPFTDNRIPLSADFHAWAAVRDDQSITGPFKRLPVLQIDGQQVAETLTIANYLHAFSGDALRLSEEDNLRHAQLLSSLYGDLMLPLGTIVGGSHVPWRRS
jgi:hypothetical protein